MRQGLSYVQIDRLNDGTYWLEDPGCGCCAGSDKATPENVQQYIQELEGALQEAREVLAELTKEKA